MMMISSNVLTMGNPDPLLAGEPGYDIGQFLSFTQHVQYVKTCGLADYQGIPNLVARRQYNIVD